MSNAPTSTSSVYDLLVVGGGINGVGIANDAAGRGLKVCLVEQDDLGAHTSSASSKLIHGGLRYLEHYEFRLVREALAEREVLLEKAPFLVTPQEFILPHQPHLRPWWLIRIGLFLYDHLSPRSTLQSSKNVFFGTANPLVPSLQRGFSYWDCWVDDARLVVLNARQAESLGATILNYHRCEALTTDGSLWTATVNDSLSNHTKIIQAKAIVNAAGPWAQYFLENQASTRSPRSIRLIRGSHLIVRRFYDGNHAYILQNQDQRIVFVVPFFNDYVMIGTTDEAHSGSPRDVQISREETHYLLDVVNRHFKQPLSESDILHTYAGVRPLCDDESDDPSAITRDYTIERTEKPDQPPMLTVFGGKLTTYRKLAESALDKLQDVFSTMTPPWTEETALIGGNSGQDVSTITEHLMARYDWLPLNLAQRWARQFGDQTWDFLEPISALSDLGPAIAGDLYEHEVRYLVEHEWARTADDVLWRRTKLGIEYADATAALDSLMESILSPS